MAKSKMIPIKMEEDVHAAAARHKRMPGEIEETVVHISSDNYRHYLQGAYALGGRYADCKGRVIGFKKGKGYLFKSLYVGFMECAGDYIEGEEDHVWVYDAKPFIEKGVKLGDNVSFTGIVYPYKRQDGSRDYGLKECFDIEVVEKYSLPDNETVSRQSVEGIICDTLCLYAEQCTGTCIVPEQKEEMIEMLLHPDDDGAA